MKTTSTKKSPWPEFEADIEDGRRLRSGRSKRKIVQAMFELMREGDINPIAVDVAKRADVGLRTVFRHFQDMESIFEEMTEELVSLTLPNIVAPFQATEWREQLIELSERVADTYEMVFPMQVALLIRRLQSDFLQKQYKQEVRLLRSSLKAILPAKIIEDKHLFAAIEVNLTFATWRRLREDIALSETNAKKTLRLAMQALVADVEVD